MTRYTCIKCGAGGASGKPLAQSPAVYACHVCGARRSMIPVEVQNIVRQARAASMRSGRECRCTMREKLVGDGCSVCNPEYAADHIPDTTKMVEPDCEDWSVFIGYLIDKCEGYEVAEENLQGWLADMIADPHYGALFRREKTADGKLVDHSLPIAMSIEVAEEEHGSLRAAAKALGIDAGYLSRLKSGEKINPGDDVLAALGLERVTMYRAMPASPTTSGDIHD